ncbi:MAG: PLP-dependent aminotransferase family protein [Bifidobacterium psychraerophilum]|uniref:aminotransferase-like domain-containing protein n=1 Tax=Bifidobacterium psychraerophilum TaxID=218140 RepID=UPI0039EA0B22
MNARILLSRRFATVSGGGVFAQKEHDGDGSAPQRPVIDYSAGVPDPTVLPYQKALQAGERVLTGPGAFASLNYSDFAGIHRLREHIADLRHVRPENVVVTNGAMQGIFLSAQALIDPGDVVLLENPVFPEAERIFRLAGARIESIPLTARGPDLDELERRLEQGSRYKAFYTVPDFQNPTGSVSDAASKNRLLALAHHYGFAVIADNPYRDLWFQRPPEEFPQQYRSADRGGQLFEIGSFSKTLGPGWRVGWIISGSEEIQAITSFRRSIDGHPSTIAQYVISELLEDRAWYASLLDRERGLYADKAGALYAAIASAFDGEVELDEPQGGYFLWTHLPDDIDLDDSRVRDELEFRGLRYVPGNAFAVKDSQARPGRISGASSPSNALRLSFAHAPREELVEGVGRLQEAVQSIRTQHHTHIPVSEEIRDSE